jgi:hypothetical protein
MKDVLGILEHLGYRELRPEESAPGAGDWRPIEDTGGRYGTTDSTDIISQKRKATARLVDRDTGQLVATARKSCPLQQTEAHA